MTVETGAGHPGARHPAPGWRVPATPDPTTPAGERACAAGTWHGGRPGLALPGVLAVAPCARAGGGGATRRWGSCPGQGALSPLGTGCATRYMPASGAVSQQHPGVQVELNTVTGVYTEKLLAMLVAGDAPDIFALDRAQLDPFVRQGHHRAVTLVKRDGAKAAGATSCPRSRLNTRIRARLWSSPSASGGRRHLLQQGRADQAGAATAQRRVDVGRSPQHGAAPDPARWGGHDAMGLGWVNLLWRALGLGQWR